LLETSILKSRRACWLLSHSEPWWGKSNYLPGHIGLAEAHALNKKRTSHSILPKALKIHRVQDLIRAWPFVCTAERFQNAEAQYRKILDADPKDLMCGPIWEI
jgi:hypothetical protein